MAKTLCELLWLRRLLVKTDFPANILMDIFCDNKPAIEIAHNLVQRDQTKHVEVDRHFINQNLETKI